MIERMKEMITLSLKAVRRKINSENRRFCFEIFGYDFVIDEYFVPWLIEVNTNPCLEESSGLLRRYLPRMLDDAFKLTLDVIFPRKRNIARPEEEPYFKPYEQEFVEPSPYPVPGYGDLENMWELIYSMVGQKPNFYTRKRR